MDHERVAVQLCKPGSPDDPVNYALADELVTELCERRLAIERARELGEREPGTRRVASE